MIEKIKGMRSKRWNMIGGIKVVEEEEKCDYVFQTPFYFEGSCNEDLFYTWLTKFLLPQ